MPLSESTKKLLASQGFTQNSSGQYTYTGGTSNNNSSNKSSNNSSSSSGSSSSLIPSSSQNTSLIPDTNYLDNQTQYLNNLVSTGDAGQQSWAKSQLNEINYLTGLINSGDSGQQSWATQELNKYTAPTTGATAVTTPVNAQQSTIDELKTMLQQYQQQASLVPQYTPYEVQEFQFTKPNYSITSDASDTSFVPTLAAKNAWLQKEQAKADSIYKNYASQLSGWQNGQDALQNQIGSLASLLPYDTLTAAQQSQLAYQEAAGVAATRQQEFENQLALLKLQSANSGSSGSGTGTGTGTATAKAPTSTQLNAQASDYISNNLKNYKRPIDFAAEVQRGISNGKINSSTGAAILKLLQSIYPDEASMKQTLSTWKG